MRIVLLILLVLMCSVASSGCAGVQSVKLSAGYGPYHAEIEILLRQADEFRQQNGPDCPKAKALEDRARALGAFEVPNK